MEELAPSHQPVAGCPEGPAESLIGEGCDPVPFQLSDMAGTRLQHRDLIKGRPLLGTQAKPVPASLTAPGTDPGACPSRSMSSLWGQPGHIQAFDRLGSRKDRGLRAATPAGVPSQPPTSLSAALGCGQMRSCSEL